MMIDRRSILVGAGAAALVGSGARAAKPDAFRPGEVWNDMNGVMINAHGGGLLRHGGRWWWHGEHKTAGDAGNRAQVGVHAYSSADLVNWRDEGVALAVSDDPTSPIARDCIL